MNERSEFEKYIEEKKEIYSNLLNFLEDSDCNDSYIKNLSDFINSKNYLEDPEEVLHFLRLITRLSSNHHRCQDFFPKLEQIFDTYNSQIKQSLSNREIFDAIKSNKVILLYFLQKEVITLDESICNEIIEKTEINGSPYSHFFIKEIKRTFSNFIEKEKIDEIENDILYKNPDFYENFDAKIRKGENDTYICSLIRNDSIEDFISYVNRTNISLSTSFINTSIFETNSFLIENEPISLIEYACFFGSIQIFQYLKMNNVELKPSLWLFSIHGKNADLIHILEDNKIKPNDSDSFVNCFIESIKCHHNDFANYFENNFLNQKDLMNEDVIFNIIYSYNYSYFPLNLSENYILINLCFNNYDKLVKILIKMKENEKNEENNDVYCVLYNKNTLDEYEFMSNKKLKAIAFPSMIQSLNESSVFRFCSSLVQVSLPSSLTEIGSHAFYGCSSLKRILIPQSVKSIKEFAFCGCSSLKQIEIPYFVESIGYQAFKECSSLQHVLILSNLIKIICCQTFEDCISLNQIKIPSSVVEIVDNVFNNCTSLKKIDIPSSVTKIGESIFNNVTSLEITGNMKKIHDKLFYKNESLRDIILPYSLILIGNYSFQSCSNLKDIIIPSSVTSIGFNAFQQCFSLEKIVIPSSVSSIKKYAFSECKRLEHITFEEPSNLKEIDEFTFCECKSIYKISIPENVALIRRGAFMDCSFVMIVNLPSSIREIEKDAFENCFKLRKVTIPDASVKIDKDAFYYKTKIDYT